MAVLNPGFLVAAVRLSAPLLLAATGELIAEEAGVLNLGVEGMMLSGALAGFLGAYATGSVWAGWLAALAAGALLALLFCLFAVILRCHPVIVALGLNLLASGGTAYAYRILFGLAPSSPAIETAPRLPIPGLARIPILGPALFDHDALVYAALLAPGAAAFLLFRTQAGTVLRAVGDNPRAADSAGISVAGVRTAATAAGGALAGLAGAYFSTVDLNVFLEDMTGGAGWIAVAIVIFGNWRPLGVGCAALLFGAAQALQLRLQGAATGIPREFLVMLPYALTLAALCGRLRRSNSPAQLCVPYVRLGETR